MIRLFNWFDRLPRDKKDHFVSGLFVSTIGVLLIGWEGSLVVIVYAALREWILDPIIRLRKADVWDFAASAIGATVPMLAALREVIF